MLCTDCRSTGPSKPAWSPLLIPHTVRFLGLQFPGVFTLVFLWRLFGYTATTLYAFPYAEQLWTPYGRVSIEPLASAPRYYGVVDSHIP
ncbi:hypothetical protein BDW68DRAFT_168221 [Aspergillus falconensis]